MTARTSFYLAYETLDYLMIEIRNEQLSDYDEVRNVNDQAFGQSGEGRIVDKLRESCKEVISLVVLSNGKIAGHIFFSPATIETPAGIITGMGLAPMAVLPDYQNKGIGSKLVTEGLRIVREKAYPFVVVLGHEKFYPLFGFQKASEFGLKCQWEGVPDDAFMALIFNDSVMHGVSGIARYRDEFNEAM